VESYVGCEKVMGLVKLVIFFLVLASYIFKALM
jgi:hypothetical protein